MDRSSFVHQKSVLRGVGSHQSSEVQLSTPGALSARETPDIGRGIRRRIRRLSVFFTREMCPWGTGTAPFFTSASGECSRLS